MDDTKSIRDAALEKQGTELPLAKEALTTAKADAKELWISSFQGHCDELVLIHQIKELAEDIHTDDNSFITHNSYDNCVLCLKNSEACDSV